MEEKRNKTKPKLIRAKTLMFRNRVQSKQVLHEEVAEMTFEKSLPRHWTIEIPHRKYTLLIHETFVEEVHLADC